MLTSCCYSCCRNSLDWQLIRDKAAELVEEMAYKAPELKDATHYPRGQNNLYDVMPIRSRYICANHTRAQASSPSSIVSPAFLVLTVRHTGCDLILLAIIEGVN